MRTEWDAIVAGASFGGLAAATELTGVGQVLLVDRLPVGAGETSACGTLLRVLERLEATEALEQVHHEIVLHLPGDRVRRIPTRYPFATLDYATLCRELFARTDAQFLQASVRGIADGWVETSKGTFKAPVVIDASGWKATLGTSLRPDLVPEQARSLGLELRMPWPEEGLHFWVRPAQIDCGVTWQFPAGEHSRVGIGCYRGKGGLKPRLEDFVGEPLPAAALHGGSFPSRLRDPVAGRVFLVGDAAGQCLPLTGEGIRPALVFGQAAGQLGRLVLQGDLDLSAALTAYRQMIRRRAAHYRLLGLVQRITLSAPPSLLRALVWMYGPGPLSRPAQDAYWQIADPDTLHPGRAVTHAA